jgi:hypothetical protein
MPKKVVTNDYTHIPPHPSIIIGVDPGKETGVAVYDMAMHTFLQHWSAPSAAFVDWLYQFFVTWCASDTVLIACERFDISPGTAKLGRTAVNWSIEQAGVCRHLARRHGQGFVLQDRATPKHMAPDALLKQVGWHKPGPDHVNDATRHVVLALARQYNQPPPWVQ